MDCLCQAFNIFKHKYTWTVDILRAALATQKRKSIIFFVLFCGYVHTYTMYAHMHTYMTKCITTRYSKVSAQNDKAFIVFYTSKAIKHKKIM